MKHLTSFTTLIYPIICLLSSGAVASSSRNNDDPNLRGGLLIKNLDHSWNSAGPLTIPAILRSLDVQTKVLDGIAQVDMVQEFQVPEFFPNEFKQTSALYQLPLDELATVVEFKAEVDDRIVKGVVKEKHEARKEYNGAIRSGHSAYLAEQTRADIFHISVGNLPKGKIVKVSLSYITTLEAIDSSTLRFVLPTDIAPRYEPYENSEESIPTAARDLMSSGVNIKMDVTMGQAIDSIESPTHEISVKKNNDNSPEGNKAQVVVSDEDPQKRDLVVYLKTQESNNSNDEPVIFIESSTEYNSTAVMLSYVPKIPDSLLDHADVKSEFVFVIDRSGSMGGSKMKQTRLAMSYILDQIPEGSLFNIVGFGSRYNALFSSGSRSIDDASAMKSAKSYIENMDADFGGEYSLIGLLVYSLSFFR